MRASSGSCSDRWTESRKYLELCHAAFRYHQYPAALNWLHEAHNLGRDHIFLHAVSHLSYIRFSLKDSDYHHALTHLFWAVCSPVMVPLERKKRVAVIGEWVPAPRNVELQKNQPGTKPMAAAAPINAPAADGS